MHGVFAVATGVLFAAGVYLMLRRSIVRLAFGLVLIGHAANLGIFTAGGLLRGEPPIIASFATQLSQSSIDPVPQALILTAIVIGFAVQAFLLVLIKRAVQENGTDDLDEMRDVDRIEEIEVQHARQK